MTRKELEHVKKVLLNIKPRENGMGIHGQVQYAISLVEKDIARRLSERDNFKDMYDFQHDW